MQFGLLHLRTKRRLMSVPNDWAALPESNAREDNLSSKWTVNISGLTASHLVALILLISVTVFSVGFLFALILVGLHLCQPPFAIELFRECRGVLSTGVLTAILLRQSRKSRFRMPKRDP